VYDDAEIEVPTNKGADIEKPKFKRHHSRSKSKGEEPVVEYVSDDSKRKQKKKHKKHYEDTTAVDRPRDGREKELDEPIISRKFKSKGGASNLTNNSIEVTRWQLVDSELDEGHNSHSYHTKRKSQRSYRS
jgi:hypothetical protein